MSLRECQERIDSREFSEWQAFYNLEPFGEDRADLRFAYLRWQIAEMFRTKGRPHRVEDFMLNFEADRTPHGNRRQTAEEMRSTLFSFSKAHNKTLKNGGNLNVKRPAHGADR